jgi:hypothetical protein
MANQQNQNTQGGTSARQVKEENLSTKGSQNQQTSDTSAESLKDSAKDTAKGLYDQAKGTAGQAAGAATKKAESAIEEQKTNLASGLTSVADSLHQVSDSLRETDEQTGITKMTAKYGDQLAQQIEQVSDYFENRDPREMLKDVEGFARRNPEIFIGAAFTLGLLAARFLKSSGKGQTSAGNNERSRNRNFQNESNNINAIDNRSAGTNRNI